MLRLFQFLSRGRLNPTGKATSGAESDDDDCAILKAQHELK